MSDKDIHDKSFAGIISSRYTLFSKNRGRNSVKGIYLYGFQIVFSTFAINVNDLRSVGMFMHIYHSVFPAM